MTDDERDEAARLQRQRRLAAERATWVINASSRATSAGSRRYTPWMTDEERYRADAQLRDEYRLTLADLSRTQQEIRRLARLFQAVGDVLAQPGPIVLEGGRDPLLESLPKEWPPINTLRGLVQERATLTLRLEALRRHLHDRGLAE